VADIHIPKHYKLLRCWGARICFLFSNYNFIDDVVQNISKVIICLIDTSGLSSEEQLRVTCLTATNFACHYKWLWEHNFEEWKKLSTLLITLEEAARTRADEKLKRIKMVGKALENKKNPKTP
jgi:hypothetical protein